MAPMRCRSPTNFMRWQHRSVQFKAPQLLSWKIPSSDQQRDTTFLRSSIFVNKTHSGAAMATEETAMANRRTNMRRIRDVLKYVVTPFDNHSCADSCARAQSGRGQWPG